MGGVGALPLRFSVEEDDDELRLELLQQEGINDKNLKALLLYRSTSLIVLFWLLRMCVQGIRYLLRSQLYGSDNVVIPNQFKDL